MAAVLSRSPADLSSSPPSSSRDPPQRLSKKSSFLSLRRDRKSISSIDAPIIAPSPALGQSSRPNDRSSTSPSAYHALHESPAPSAPRRSSSRVRAHGRKASKSVSSTHEQPSSSNCASRGKERQHRNREGLHDTVEHGSQPFPTMGHEKTLSGSSHTTTRSRRRSHTGRSKTHGSSTPPHNRPFNISLLDSASSVLSHYEDTPRTPVDELSFREPVFSMPVVVAAPVSGVEMMDALVDGMNHRYGSDDHFMGMGGISGRMKVSKSGYHPLYHPPLPTPPPGVVLGKVSQRQQPPQSRESDEDDDKTQVVVPRWSEHKRRNTGSSRKASTNFNSPSPSRPPSSHSVDTQVGSSRHVAPSISEIIRAHAPPSQQVRSRKSSLAHSAGHGTLHEHVEPALSPPEEEGDLISRSSVDTIAEEVQRTIRNQNRSSVSPRPLHLSRSFQRTPSALSESTRTLSSPRSEGRRESSLFSYSTQSDHPHLPAADFAGLTKLPTSSPSQTIAQYLRSARLTTLLSLVRSPHASREHPLTVSLSDLGSPHGFPLVVFLGLGCVRHIMGLYDEMAECLGLRLITIDRWGLGRTDIPRSKAARGILEWTSVVEEVLDQLHIDQCSVMAHSAGAPYALAFANRFPERIRGDVCLLAPWVGGGEGAGYKWLKYVPNGILKTAQAAEWKVQAWMIGKPPTFAFEGIGYDATTSSASSVTHGSNVTSPHASSKSPPTSTRTSTHLLRVDEVQPRPSMSSGVFSEYDDLRDFEGRFESMSTLERKSSGSDHDRTVTITKVATRKPSRGFLGRLKSGHTCQPQLPPEEKSTLPRTGKKLKVLRSMGSLKGRSKLPPVEVPARPPEVPRLPASMGPDIGLGLDHLDFTDTVRIKSSSTPPFCSDSGAMKGKETSLETADEQLFSTRAHGRRSISLVAPERPRLSDPTPPNSPLPDDSSPANFQAALGNALLAASHAESSKGTHRDLLQILNHDRQPWGFSYIAYPHTVRVWYGDRDERIAENAVRWMENTMGPDKCRVQVVPGADHALMYRSGVVVDVLEKVCEFWREYLGSMPSASVRERCLRAQTRTVETIARTARKAMVEESATARATWEEISDDVNSEDEGRADVDVVVCTVPDEYEACKGDDVEPDCDDADVENVHAAVEDPIREVVIVCDGTEAEAEVEEDVEKAGVDMVEVGAGDKFGDPGAASDGEKRGEFEIFSAETVDTLENFFNVVAAEGNDRENAEVLAVVLPKPVDMDPVLVTRLGNEVFGLPENEVPRELPAIKVDVLGEREAKEEEPESLAEIGEEISDEVLANVEIAPALLLLRMLEILGREDVGERAQGMIGVAADKYVESVVEAIGHGNG
ncbi:uncharacterized protein FIBRA_02929 [Fibroporia radiculosa]|uniref:AB hydrolase-1 domain-containing protein n=1 Tax=Fibroporia radiculosa TaxID=599839 RepID=J4G3G4_9APHY|nr:uncharacterized protein FIBRA_02929 [Fibroporia radiculosa]CCM00883.1 predicted protein [Fibroporia radiculosa]